MKTTVSRTFSRLFFAKHSKPSPRRRPGPRSEPDSGLRRDDFSKRLRFVIEHLLACALLLLLIGCMTAGPDYRRPEVNAPDKWRFAETEARDLANAAWWQRFNDPVLNGLIAAAIRENLDLRVATARVEEFFGRYFSTRGDRFPEIFAGATAGRQRVSEEGPTPVPPGTDATFDYYEAFLGGSWELDFWGRYYRAAEAARAELTATAEGRRAVILTLVTAVAGSYVELRAFDKQLDITRREAKTRKETLDVFQMRFDKGIIPEVDLSQAQSQYQEVMARIPEIELAIALQENNLSVLLGRYPGDIPRGRSISALDLPPVPADIPSAVLEKRPDIQIAEQELAAANARIGVAKSLYYPSISLTGALGTVSTELSELFSNDSKTWSINAPITVPIFTFGRIGGEVEAARAQQRQALFNYLLTVQTAFREVDDALVSQAKTRRQLAALARQVDALKDYVRLAWMRYDEGYTSYLEVLDAQRSLYDVELAYTQTRANLFQSLVNVYRAMGGGWIAEAEDLDAPLPVKKAGFIP